MTSKHKHEISRLNPPDEECVDFDLLPWRSEKTAAGAIIQALKFMQKRIGFQTTYEFWDFCNRHYLGGENVQSKDL